MAHKVYGQSVPDRHVYRGRFRGYRMLAFGRAQILDYEAEITVKQATWNPQWWIAVDGRGKVDPAFSAPRAEDTMRLVAAGFTTCLQNWETFEVGGLKGARKLGPQLVPAKVKKVG
jgi:hypothetical protein